MTTRTYLDVPFSEKDAAKDAGARWDAARRMWYAPAGLNEQLQRWAQPTEDLTIEGEDRTFGDDGPRLIVDLVPRTSWAANVRSLMPAGQWRDLSRRVRARAGDRCESCGGTFRPQQLAAHERFSFDERTRTQRLERLVALCTACHLATHYGFACTQQREDEALAQLELVNEWTRPHAKRHVRTAYAVWEQRSQIEWTVDLSILEAIMPLQVPQRPVEPLSPVEAPPALSTQPSAPAALLAHVTPNLPALLAAVPALMRVTGIVIHPGDVEGLSEIPSSGRTDTGYVIDVAGESMPVWASRSCGPGRIEALIAFCE